MNSADLPIEKQRTLHENGASLPYNSRMSYLEIILPFGIPPASLAKQLLQQAQVPSLSRLISFAKPSHSMRLSQFARLLPHEYWVYTRESSHTKPKLANPDDRYTSPAIAHNLMMSAGLIATDSKDHTAHWFVLQPAHIHIARDHLVLTDPGRLDITEKEAQELFKIAAEICNESGFSLRFGDLKTWFLRADPWRDLQTASVSAAAGHNMDIWMAEGEHARAWRKLQNEIQMAWHACAINVEREAIGEAAINSVWIHGGSSDLHAVQVERGIQNLNKFLSGTVNNNHGKIVQIDELLEPALNSDWGEWLIQLNALERQCFAPLLQALESGHLDSFELVLSDGEQIAAFMCRKSHWFHRFKKPNLQRLHNLVSPV